MQRIITEHRDKRGRGGEKESAHKRFLLVPPTT